MAYTDVGAQLQHPLLEDTLRPAPDRDQAARAYVIRRCPDDWDTVLNALGIGDT